MSNYLTPQQQREQRRFMLTSALGMDSLTPRQARLLDGLTERDTNTVSELAGLIRLSKASVHKEGE